MTHTPTTDRVGGDLQDTLVELSDLALIAKQLHWNVTGSRFRSVHEQLDEIAALARTAADLIAERAVAVGYAPDARAITVAKDSPLPDVADGRVADTEAVASVVAALDVLTARVTERVRRLGELDPVSQDLLIGLQADLEKQRWMFDAQQR